MHWIVSYILYFIKHFSFMQIKLKLVNGFHCWPRNNYFPVLFHFAILSYSLRVYFILNLIFYPNKCVKSVLLTLIKHYSLQHLQRQKLSLMLLKVSIRDKYVLPHFHSMQIYFTKCSKIVDSSLWKFKCYKSKEQINCL